MPKKQKISVSKILLSIFLGLIVAGAGRIGVFQFTPDLSHTFFAPVPSIEFDYTHVGKTVLLMYGFPFSTYTDCSIILSGTLPRAVCANETIVGEYSIFLNAIFWSGIILLITLIPIYFFRTNNPSP